MEKVYNIPWPEKNPVFQRLAEISDLGSLSKEERLKYDEALRKYRDTLCVMQGQYDEGIQVGMEKGMEMGMEKGMEKGIQIGRKQAMEEAQSNLASIIRNLKAQHVPLDVIALSTNLSVQDIENIS